MRTDHCWGLEDLDGEGLEQALAESASHVDAALAKQLALIRVFDERREWAHYGARSCTEWLGWRLGMSPSVARERTRVAHALGKLPAMEAALASGPLSYSKVRAMTRVATPELEATLLDYASKTTAAQLERICRGYREVKDDGADREPPERTVSRRPTRDGRVRITAVLLPDEAEIVWEALQQAATAAGTEMGGRPPANDTSADTSTDASTDASAETIPADSPLSAKNVSAETPPRPHDAGAAADQPAPAETIPAETPDSAKNVSAETPPRDDDADPEDQGAPPDPCDDLPRALRHERELREARLEPTQPTGRASLPDALVWLAERTLKGRLDTTTGAGTYQVVVHLERDVLDPKGFEARLPDGTPLHPDTFHRIACDASLVPALFDEQGRVLDVGRKTRAIPTAIRRALQARDRHCAFPGCDSRRWLHGHHIEPWHAGGETRLGNLVLLCSFHHQLVHEQGYGVRLLPSGKAAFYYPSGVRIAPVPRRPHAPRDARGSTAGNPPDIAARDVPDWDGRQPDYDACVAALQSA